MTPPRAIPLLVGVALFAVACGRGTDPVIAHSGPPAVNAATAAMLPKTTDALPDIDTASYDALLTQLRGTPVVVNVWAAWCIPCRDEAPLLADAARRFGTEVQFVGVDIQDSRSGGRGFIGEFGWPYPSFFDAPGAIATDLGLLGPPGTFFYNRDGELVDSVRGLLSASALERGIQQIRS